MSVQQLISRLGECRRHLSELRGRPDYLPLHCSILRGEGPGWHSVLYGPTCPFVRILDARPYARQENIEHGDIFYLAFYAHPNSAELDRVNAALSTVESLTMEALRLLSALPRPARDRLCLPESGHWWRTVFHLAWHFSRPFLRARRCRLLTKDAQSYSCNEETFLQQFGTGGQRDFLPGLIYSKLDHDICISS